MHEREGLSNPQLGGSFEIMRNLNLENNENWGGKQSLFHAKGQALLSYDSKVFQEKN